MRRSQKNLCVDAKVADVKLPDVGNGCEHLDVVSLLRGVVEEDPGQLQVGQRPKLPEASSSDAQAQHQPPEIGRLDDPPAWDELVATDGEGDALQAELHERRRGRRDHGLQLQPRMRTSENHVLQIELG